VSGLRVVPASTRVTIDSETARLLRSLPKDSDVVPAQIMGSIRGSGAEADRPLALALNGNVVATTRTYRDGSTVRYSAMAPESALHLGRNDVELFWIVKTGNGLELERLAG
jgi:hypothetical protein